MERERENKRLFHRAISPLPPLIFVNIGRANIQSKVFATKGKTRHKRQI